MVQGQTPFVHVGQSSQRFADIKQGKDAVKRFVPLSHQQLAQNQPEAFLVQVSINGGP